MEEPFRVTYRGRPAVEDHGLFQTRFHGESPKVENIERAEIPSPSISDPNGMDKGGRGGRRGRKVAQRMVDDDFWGELEKATDSSKNKNIESTATNPFGIGPGNFERKKAKLEAKEDHGNTESFRIAPDMEKRQAIQQSLKRTIKPSGDYKQVVSSLKDKQKVQETKQDTLIDDMIDHVMYGLRGAAPAGFHFDEETSKQVTEHNLKAVWNLLADARYREKLIKNLQILIFALIKRGDQERVAMILSAVPKGTKQGFYGTTICRVIFESGPPLHAPQLGSNTVCQGCLGVMSPEMQHEYEIFLMSLTFN